VKEPAEGREKRKRNEKKNEKVRQEKVISAWNILCRPTRTYAVGFLTLAIRASVVNEHPDRTLSIMGHSLQVKQFF
jgi:hypothetical protein